MKVSIFLGIIYAVVPFWRQKHFSRINDNLIVNERTIENLVETYVIQGLLVADFI